MSSKISVIVPTYNSEKWLPRCIESIISQSYQNLEIIIVENCSTDDTIKILEYYNKRDNRIKIITEGRKGVGYARNRGIDVAIGDYICFVDSDDYIASNFCEKLLLNIQGHDIAVCGVSVEADKQNTSFSCIEETTVVNSIDFIKLIFEMKYSSHPVWNKMYRSELIKKNNLKFVEGKVYEDISYSFQTAMAAQSSIFIDESLYTYCIRKNSLATTVSDQNIYDYTYQFKILRDLFINSNMLHYVINEYKYAILYALYQLNRMYTENLDMSAEVFKENSKELLNIIYEARYYKALD